MAQSKGSSISGELREFGAFSKAMVPIVRESCPIQQSSSLAMNKHQGKINCFYCCIYLFLLYSVGLFSCSYPN